MKVAHFINSCDPGGAETLVLDLCTHLPSNIKNVVFAFKNSWIYTQCKERGISVESIPYEEVWSLKYFPKFVYKFSKFLKERQIDILHNHLYAATIRGGVAARLAQIPSLATLHDTISIEEKPSRAWGLNVLSSLFGTKLVAISKNVKNIHSSLGKIGEENIALVLNGVDIDKFICYNDIYETRSKLGIGHDEQVIFTAGRLVHEKNIAILLQSIKHINTKIPYKVVVAGTGPQEQSLKELTKKLSIQDKVLFLGHRKDISDLLNMSNLYVSTSIKEGLGISIQEAMAAGLPVLATNVGGVNELVDHCKTGILISDPKNAVSIGQAITYLISNPLVSILYGKNGALKAKEFFSIQNTAKHYSDLYSQIRLCQ